MEYQSHILCEKIMRLLMILIVIKQSIKISIRLLFSQILF